MAQDTSNTMTRLQTLQTTVKWYHVEFKAEILLDTYSTMLSDQSIILAMNSSFIDPSLQFESQLRIIELSFKKAFSLPTLNTVKSMGKNPEEIRDLQSLYENIFNVYEDTLIILVSKDFYKIQILKEMVTWMSQNKQYLQERVMMLITRVLIFASRRVKKYPSIDAPCLGLLAAELSLLCAHEDPLITQQAITGMNYVLKIAMYQKSNLVKRKSSVASDRETNNPKEITSDFELLSKTMQGDRSKIAQSVGQTLLPHLLSDFVWTLLRKLFSSNKESALEAAFLLNLTLEYHAQKITTVSKIVDDIYEQLSGNFSHPMNVVLLRVISLLTRAFPKKVIFQLMEFPVPADKTLSECNFPQFPETLHYVYKVAVEGPRRSEDSIVTIIFFAELLNNFFKESLPKEFLVLFRNWINDPNPSVGKMSLQKIASMAPVFSELENVCNLLLPVLDAFLSKEYTVVIRAMLTLRNILSKLDKEIYSTVCTRIASSYCPLMDHVNSDIQCMAIRHFGELLLDMSHYKRMLNHVIIGSLVPLLLFLESNEIRLVNACRYTLTICFSQLKWSISHLLREENYCFESVVLNICNNLLSSYESYITDLISGTLGFLWSSRTFLKKGATILIGYLGKSGAHLLLKEEIDVMIEVIERVARDEDPVIKLLAEKTRKIFREIAYRIASSTIRQTFRRWAMMFHTKKLKLIYDLANITSLEESIPEDFTEVKPEDNPENLVEEKPEYLFQEKRVSFAS
ncbi:maestro heat-like repeat-containing protein family member 9 isoform X3 [Peromyscus eremicus]|uniref:maestro heat-like repeat-containing protein family member 9 isoform X3 n=1 Tax=Peromyscus eremicus TaxID=42410 RepID=UPI0027DE72AE|nr:maestro heat-like repeat-containing protein family member 9 isoform X3 [Peromyscus eremicus]